MMDLPTPSAPSELLQPSNLRLLEVSFPCCTTKVKAKPDPSYYDFQERLHLAVAQQTEWLSKACNFHRDLHKDLNLNSAIDPTSLQRKILSQSWEAGSVFLRIIKDSKEAEIGDEKTGWICSQQDYTKLLDGDFKEIKLSSEKRIQSSESLQKEVELLKRELNILKTQTKEEKKKDTSSPSPKPFVVPCTEDVSVLAKFGDEFFWGRIIKVFPDDTYRILYNDGDERIKTRKDIVAVVVGNFRMICKDGYKISNK